MHALRYVLAVLLLGLHTEAEAQSPAFAVDTSTVALYTFDGADPDTTLDVSGNGHHAFNDGTTSVPGRHGNARQFDGVADRIDMDAVRVALQGTDAWTLEYIAATTDGGWVPIVLTHTCGNGWRLQATGTSARVGYKSTTTGGNCVWGGDQTLTIPALGTDWHYFALAFGEGALRFYLDGRLITSVGATGLFQGGGGGQRAWVGHSDSGGGAYFPGLADELRVSDIARTAGEICATASALGWTCPPVANEPDADVPSADRLVASPNPFTSQTTLRYGVPEAGRVRLAVHDLLGRTIAVLVDEVRPVGSHTAVLEGKHLAPGTYLLRLSAPDGSVRTEWLSLVR